MLNQRLINQLEPILNRLHTAISLLDIRGNSLIPASEIRYTLPALTEPGVPVRADGRIWQICASSRDLVLMSILQENEQIQDAFTLCDAMIGAVLRANAMSSDLNSTYQRLLENDLSLTEIDAVADEYHIRNNISRCVMVLHMVQVQDSSTQEILNEIIPKGHHDVLVSMDRHTSVLIKDVSGMEEIADIIEYAQALRETLLSEDALDVTIGIGEVIQAVQNLHESYRQAKRAIEIGRSFREGESVHVYRYMLLERFLTDLSPELAEHYYGLLFNRQTSRLFSEEILSTIEMFFRKDLNLSDTARQLYIHRNTLVYRLDKIQRQVGLDLRKFEDAVTFKMLYEMRRCFDNRNRNRKTH